MKLIIGNKYQVLESGLNRWIEDCIYIGQEKDYDNHVFVLYDNHPFSPNKMILLYINEDNIETDLKEN